MTSSGILKKGLAASAISALAVTGVPALSGSANAAIGDAFTVVSTGPALNGGAEGAVVVLRAADLTITPNLIKAAGSANDAAGSQNSGSQTVSIVGVPTVANDPSNSAFDLITVRVAVTTPAPGATAAFRLFEDDAVTNNAVDAAEARQPVSISTAGPVTSILVDPINQTTPTGTVSGPYTVTVRDGGNRVTQLAPGQTVTVAPAAPVTVSDASLDSTDLATGTTSFTANPNAAAAGTYGINLTSGAINTTATLNVVQAGVITAANLDIVTPDEADTWDGLGDGTDGGTTQVRVDQTMVTFNIDADGAQRGTTVSASVDGTGVTFGGQDTATFTTTLDINGNGAIPVTPEGISEGDSFTVSINGVDQTITYVRAAATSVDGQLTTYFCQLNAACTVTAVVLDQFGNPITSGEVSASRAGVNNDVTPQRAAVGADGTVDFTFTDTANVTNGVDTVTFSYFTDAFDNAANFSDSSTRIRYSATGQGADYTISLDGNSTEADVYSADDAAVVPLSDAEANGGVEDSVIGITGGEPNQEVTLSVDNDARILEPGETLLSDGSASVDTNLTAGGALPAGYRVVGTTSGLVTLTVATANRTETAPLTVQTQSDASSARNVSLSSLATVVSGTNQVVFTALITDAFGNPVAGVSNAALNKQVTGPGNYQDGDAVSDINGLIKLNVQLDDNAVGAVTLTVDGRGTTFNQFGANVDRLYFDDTTDTALGFAGSMPTASATTIVENPTGPNPKVAVKANAKAPNNGAKADKITVKVTPRGVANGAKVKLFRVKATANGNRAKAVGGTKTLRNNTAKFTVADRNGNAKTRYFAVVQGTVDTLKDRSGNVNVR